MRVGAAVSAVDCIQRTSQTLQIVQSLHSQVELWPVSCDRHSRVRANAKD